MEPFVKQIRAGGDRNFAYLFGDDEVCAVVDPSYDEGGKVSREIEQTKLKLEWILITHGDPDHIYSAQKISQNYGAQIAAHSSCKQPVHYWLNDGDEVTMGSLSIKAIYTPGHTIDSMCFLCGKWLFTGDTLFIGKVGGTDFGAGAKAEYDSLHYKLMRLPVDTIVYPGHDYGLKPVSTIGDEKKNNPFIQCLSFDAFVDLKRNWQEYKRKHGIP
ncbi:MAG: MBL fold metallo-hydrolase [FCB group bacterium]|nr:MBL fold metallo-hydrolase [FCB group bacterium]